MEKSWQGYLVALGNQKKPHTTIDTAAFPTTEGNTTSSGFIEWRTPNPQQQSKYDAMSGSWQGVQASEAGASKIFKADYMPVNK